VFANSRPSSPTPLKVHKHGNWHRPEQCQFLATEVSRDFIPPCPVRISPAQAAALGPAIGRMRNPSSQLNDDARAKDMPDRAPSTIGGVFSRASPRSLRPASQVPGHCGENHPFHLIYWRSTNAKRTSQCELPSRPPVSFLFKLPLLRHGAQIVVSQPPAVLRLFNRKLRLRSLDRSSQPQSSAS
jgi:hypothetical protein